MNARQRFAEDVELPLVHQVAELIGPDAWSALLRDFGGKRLYIPATAGAAHPITVSIGIEGARKMAAAYAGTYVEIPLSPSRRMRILDLLRSGHKPADIARLVGCTRRHVYQVRAEAPDAAGRQPGLFD